MGSAGKDRRYHAAVVASGISTLGWLTSFIAAIYLTYLVVIGNPSGLVAIVVIVTLAAGIGFALLEKRLYRLDHG